jgi:hypothetical protein
MESAQSYRDRATQHRELACAERDILIRRRLIQMALRFDEFADQIEDKTADRSRGEVHDSL